jgi:HTH-type transcriptional regulator, competence development regulator
MIKWQKQKFGKFIRNARIDRGITQKQLSKIAKISPAYVSRMERGDLPYRPTKEVLDRLGWALRIDIDKAYGYTARFDELYNSLFNKHQDEFPALLKLLDENQVFARGVFDQVSLSKDLTGIKAS